MERIFLLSSANHLIENIALKIIFICSLELADCFLTSKLFGASKMKSLILENSPIKYYIDDTANNEWLVFIHAAFVDHRMFEKQFAYFSGKYNLLAVDILGHGNSINAKKGDTTSKMSDWINQIFEKHNISAAHFVGVSLGN